MPTPLETFLNSEAVGFPLVGIRAKALRLNRGLSIRQLAKDAEVDKNTILRLESGKPVSERVLDNVCRSLGTIPTGLTMGTQDPVRIRVFRSDDTNWMSINQREEAKGHLPNYTVVPESSERERYGRLGFTCGFLMPHSCTIADGKLLAAVFEVHHPRTRGHEHAGEEFLYCIRGPVRAMVGDEIHVLEQGDSISFDSSLPHNFERVLPPPSPAPQVLSVWIECFTENKTSHA
jgi:transcriptional regulator with XRE-family HTH domain